MSTTLTGAPVSPGRATGVVVTMPAPVPEPPEGTVAPAEAEAAVDRLAAATDAVRERLEALAGTATGTAAEVLTVTAAMAADPTLASDAQRRVRDEGRTPERAVWDAANALAAQLEPLGPPLSERARDVRDVRDRIVAELTGVRPPGVPSPGHPFVLLAEDLAPADTATLDPAVVVAIVTSGGGPTSHTAILARALGIPAVVAVTGALELAEGERVVVDGGAGTVVRDPSDAEVAAAERAVHVERTFDGQGRTSDGHRVELLANVADPAAAKAAVDAHAEGVGLFRTEFCFLGRDTEPPVAEQVEAYRGVLGAFAGKKVVVRTLDAGADKPLPFVTADDEPNPALGVRGLRTAAGHPEVLDRQLQAIAEAAAAEEADVWVMAPMVATTAEALGFVDACERHGLRRAGVMVEVPAAALRSRWIFAHARFGSIGTNDLVQYTMAADRMLGPLAALSTSWQPAVLELVRSTCEGAAQHARPVGVCGEAAADAVLAPVLVGLGVKSLSMTPRALADVAAVLSRVSFAHCRALAHLVLEEPDADAARAAVRRELADVLEELAL
ncbi:phosphoenolpyruvate--protein phosphotransferase [Isoptericola sp. NEAU-Y5]|uniref:Phosphoenolpyruvate-protein phosphotransferase n=1 Tax=Isoptericola luteus TaxID=2879484 RepID=A0ABS7ZED3_9MICO|nr:phosphoenolpyruvate--protein phosphotransferase [Isoptericola sp. NEAU-Y5]MCA5891969.1 phosphoenolpyruvate--protein phosphotransferase [Isoptericola sp. NEAU-Y5]